MGRTAKGLRNIPHEKTKTIIIKKKITSLNYTTQSKNFSESVVQNIVTESAFKFISHHRVVLQDAHTNMTA